MWKELYIQFISDFTDLSGEFFYRVPQNYYSKEILNTFRQLKSEETICLRNMLDELEGRLFVKSLVDAANFVPKSMLEDFVKCAVYCDNPSYNEKYLIHPIKQNRRKVYKQLIRYLVDGNNYEKGGAASAFYWYFALCETKIKEETENALIEMAHQFQTCNDLDARRRLIGLLTSASTNNLSKNVRIKVNETINLARSIEDEYIKNRVSVSEGSTKLYNPLPGRGSKG